MEGWIKIHRKIINHWIWANPDYVKAWITIILTVNHDDSKVLIHGEVISCNRGQSILSLQNWAKLFGRKWTIQKVRTFFNLLQVDKMICTEGLRKTTRLTVCNYDSYQDEQHTNNTQTTHKQHTDNTQITTNKNDKNDKNDKNIIKENLQKKKFIKPTIQEITDYCLERKNKVSPEKFYNYYESNGWKVGKNPMKDWKAAVRTWENSGFDNSTKKDQPQILIYR